MDTNKPVPPVRQPSLSNKENVPNTPLPPPPMHPGSLSNPNIANGSTATLSSDHGTASSNSVSAVPTRKIPLTGYVGFDTITHQIEKKLVKRGFTLNLMTVGRSGLGKSTLINTLFASHLVDSKGTKKASDPYRKTTEIMNTTQVIEENGIRLRLTITDTPGYGDQINNENCWEPIVKYIKEQYSTFLRKELTPAREKRIPDTRVHCVLFFVSPTGHALTPLDIAVMRKLSDIANVIPVIAKSDSLTLEERAAFKKRIREEIEFHGIRLYPHMEAEEEASLSESDRIDRNLVHQVLEMIPFCVVGSERNIVIDGKAVRGRRTRWGMINVENENHCEFVALRNFLMRTHLQDMIETTSSLHYEAFRTKQLLALKESTSLGIRPGGSSTADIDRR